MRTYRVWDIGLDFTSAISAETARKAKAMWFAENKDYGVEYVSIRAKWQRFAVETRLSYDTDFWQVEETSADLESAKKYVEYICGRWPEWEREWRDGYLYYKDKGGYTPARIKRI